MSKQANFFTVRNDVDSAVFHSVLYHAARYPTVAADQRLITDVAWAALNHLPAQRPRRCGAAARPSEAIDRAVLAAYDQVFARSATSAREYIQNLHVEIESVVAA